jgi:isopentenyl-diphosphate Delta-isomerase
VDGAHRRLTEKRPEGYRVLIDPAATPPAPRSRKDDHLDLCASGDVGFRAKTTLLKEVELFHDALPDRALADVSLATPLLGRSLRAPLIIAAMTGGVERAEAINRDLAAIAEETGVAFALGSQRPLLERGRREGYFVRDVAPTALLLGNVGLVQARETTTARLAALVRDTGLDALCVHLNPAMEAVQAGGDRDFGRGTETLRRLVGELRVPIVVKETGCGISRAVGERLVACGVKTVDVGGAGGTSWVGVESKRAGGEAAVIGERFWDWGIPTAASVAQLSGLPLEVIATGGVAHGLDVARALALGARAAGIARPLLQAWASGGRDGAAAMVSRIVEELRRACWLCGVGRAAELSAAPIVVGPALRRWVPTASPLAARLAATLA